MEEGSTALVEEGSTALVEEDSPPLVTGAAAAGVVSGSSANALVGTLAPPSRTSLGPSLTDFVPLALGASTAVAGSSCRKILDVVMFLHD